MTQSSQTLMTALQERFAQALSSLTHDRGETTIEIPRAGMLDIMRALRDEPPLRFEQLIDVCGVDYLTYDQDEWTTDEASGSGFSRGVNRGPEFIKEREGPRFAAVYQLLSLAHNQRLRVRVFCEDDEMPIVDSVTGIWESAGWFEREAFDLYGIFFEGHPDLRRILTDYGFVGHPFRKDFPIIGNVEVRYDPERQRVVYQPVSIEPRTLVPRVIRKDEHERHDTSPEVRDPDA